jgi:predicted phosphodiesterase
MKIAIISDIHGNFPALQTVIEDIDAWRPDRVLVAGDVINRGPSPVPCLELVQERVERDGWQLVRGNHEDYVLVHTEPDAPRSGPMFEYLRSSFWTFEQLNGHVSYLEKLPFQTSLVGPDGREVRAVHASMRGNRDGIYYKTEMEEVRRQIEPAPAVFCTGHTHFPLVREVDETLVVNAGSVGIPFDGDRRAAYARLTWQEGGLRPGWQAEIVRLAYDYAEAEKDYEVNGYLEGAGPLANLMLTEFRLARAHLHRWAQHYEKAVLSGEMTMAESVAAYWLVAGL